MPADGPQREAEKEQMRARHRVQGSGGQERPSRCAQDSEAEPSASQSLSDGPRSRAPSTAPPVA
eukprot:6352621-Pyramimonas_sp.AAC.1